MPKKNELTSLENKILEQMKLDELQEEWDRNHPEWRTVMIDDVETNYAVSNTGLVKNIKRNFILSPVTNNKGYLGVAIYINGKEHKKLVHRLVTIAFVPNLDGKPYVNHKDANKQNNYYRNLEWCTQKENIQHASRLGLMSPGTDHYSNIHTDEQIHDVCKLLEKGDLSMVQIAEVTGVTFGVIAAIKDGRTWVHISKEYAIPEPKPMITEEQVHQICKLLLNSNTPIRDISEMTGVTDVIVRQIRAGESWVHISSQYVIPRRTGKDRIRKIIEWVSDGLDNSTIVQKLEAEFDMSDQRAARECIYAVKKRYNLVQRSTTIPNTISLEKDYDNSKEEVHPKLMRD